MERIADRCTRVYYQDSEGRNTWQLYNGWLTKTQCQDLHPSAFAATHVDKCINCGWVFYNSRQKTC